MLSEERFANPNWRKCSNGSLVTSLTASLRLELALQMFNFYSAFSVCTIVGSAAINIFFWCKYNARPYRIFMQVI